MKPTSRNNGHIRSDDGQTDRHTDIHSPIPLIDSAHPVGWAEWKQKLTHNKCFKSSASKTNRHSPGPDVSRNSLHPTPQVLILKIAVLSWPFVYMYTGVVETTMLSYNRSKLILIIFSSVFPKSAVGVSNITGEQVKTRLWGATHRHRHWHQQH